MIDLLTQSTHLKVLYTDASEEEISKSENILKKKFCAKDTSLSNTIPVKRGFASDIRSFYNLDHNILPIGFLPYLEYYYEKNGLDFTIKEMRRFAKVDKIFLKALMKDEIELGGETPRFYQKEAVIELVKNKFGGVEIPTGGGKSLIMALLCLVYSTSKIIIIQNTLDLVQQTYEKFSDYGLEDELGVIQGGNVIDDKRITILSMQSYEKAFELFPYVQIILCDEAHETGRTPTSEKIIYSCQNCANKFAISATMDTIDNPYERMRLIGNLGPIVYKKEMIEQMEDNFLTDTKVEIYSYQCDPITIIGSYATVYDTKKVSKKNSKELLIENGYEIFSKAGEEFGRKFICNGDEYNHFVNNEARNNKIVEIVRKYLAQNKRILVIFNLTEHGEILQKLIPEAVVIDGGDDLNVRKDAENHLRENETSVVLSSRIWSKGKDIQSIDVVLNVIGGHATTAQIQRLGRVVRLSKDTGKEMAVYCDFDDRVLSPIGIKQFNKRLNIYENILKLPVEFL